MNFDGPGWAAFFSEDGADTGHRILVSEDWCDGGLVVVCEGSGTYRTKIAEEVESELPYLLRFHGYSVTEPHEAIRKTLLDLDGRIRHIGPGGMTLALAHVTNELVVAAHVGNSRASIVGDGRCDDLIRGADRSELRRSHAIGRGLSSSTTCEADIAVTRRDTSAAFLFIATTRVWSALTGPEGQVAIQSISSKDDHPHSALGKLLAACDQSKLTHCAAVVADLRTQAT